MVKHIVNDIRKLISKPGKLNHMLGKHHSEVAKKKHK